MKNKNENSLRFNLVDLVLTMIIFAAIALGAVYFMYSRLSSGVDGAEGKTYTIEYVVSMDIVNVKYHGCISVGDEVTDVTRAFVLGDVIDVKYSDATFTALNEETGELDSTLVYPDHEKVDVTLRSKAKLENNQYRIGEVQLSVGSKIAYRVPNFLGEGFCTSITRIN